MEKQLEEKLFNDNYRLVWYVVREQEKKKGGLAATRMSREDLAQELSIELVRAIRAWDQQGPLATVCLTFMENRLASILRKASSQKRLTDRLTIDNEEIDLSYIPDPEVGPELWTELSVAFDTLSEDDQILARWILEGYTLKSMGEKLGITPSAVASRRKRLAKKLAPLREALLEA